MLEKIHSNNGLQLILGLITGIIFGYLLQKGGVTTYDVIMGQLLLTDFTVLKVMLSAVIIGMTGVHILRSMGLVNLHPKPGSLGATAMGGLIFGVGFGVLGYCPGTVAGAVGQGWLDVLVGGLTGIIAGSGVFAHFYPALNRGLLQKGDFAEMTVPAFFKVNPWGVVVPVAVVLILFLYWLEIKGF